MNAHHVSAEQLVDVVAAAVRAPSIHNTQPWRFHVADDTIDVYPDRSRQLTATDPSGRALRMSCGAALFNARLAVHRLGYEPQVRLFDASDGPIAQIRVGEARPPTPAESALYDAIARRQSNRYPFLDTEVPLGTRADLVAAARDEGAWLDLVVGADALDVIAEAVRAADRVLLADDQYRGELAEWTRSQPDSPEGVPAAASGPVTEPHDLLARRDFGGRRRAEGRDYEAQPLVGVFGGFTDSPISDVHVGEALQRVLLTATSEGLVTSISSQVMDVPHIREQLRIGLRRTGAPDLVLRFGYGPPAPRTKRRPIEDVLVLTAPTGRAL